MIDTNELRALRTLATGKYWERYGFIGSGGLDKVRCPSGCDRVGRQLYTEIPATGDDAKFICYVANNAIDIADELDALRAENATAQRYVSDANEEINALRAEVERLQGAIHLARIQYRGCGGRLTPAETVEAMMEVLNEIEAIDGPPLRCTCGASSDPGACGHHPACPMKEKEG